ncbi:MAG TPA: phosphopantetheine-binding protein [Bacteroidales bacterium]|nr:phosphopantetheine-binding protein [Bacteroidales bacterium]HPF02527.1 phosphopantetheine-binding protein [Bacteroidales bacterium]HPJ58364.1 phosphopantetheine-binding protein [Bacteroidales bacterium]HPR10830.1 phosphopantetheine-binding protein [Bacteroidales bacterium]HRW84210.1 phosphopantetheine-binding protein [Bacteroidales bacterium]
MTRENIERTINGLLVEEFEIEQSVISPDAHLKDDLGLESLDFVDIAVIVQKEFGLTLKGEEMTSIRTLQNLYDHIDNCVRKK